MANELKAFHEDRFDNGGFDLASLDLEQCQRVGLFLAQSARYLGLSEGHAQRQPAAWCCAAPSATEGTGFAANV